MNAKTPLGQPADPSGETATTSIQAPVIDSIIGKLWANTFIKEFVLMMIATVGLQVAAALIVLSGQLDNVHDLSELYTTLHGWIGGAVSAIILTAFKQGIAFIIARMAGTKL